MESNEVLILGQIVMVFVLASIATEVYRIRRLLETISSTSFGGKG